MYAVMLLLSLGIYVSVAVYFFRSPYASIFHPLMLYLAFHGFIFVFRPIVIYMADYDYVYRVYHFHPSLADKLTTLGATNLGLLAFAYFSLRAGNARMIFKSDAAHDAERSLVSKVLPLMLAICVPLGVYSLFRAVGVGVTGETTMVLKDNIRINTTDVGYLTDAMLLLVPICALAAWYWRFRLVALAPLAIFFVLKASTGGRGPFVVAAFATALFYFYDRKIRLPSVRIFVIVAFVGFVFNTIGTDRGYALRETLGFQNQTERTGNDQLRFMEGQDFANLEYFEFAVYVVPQRSGTYDYFLNNLQLLTEPIPRVLWPGKPAGAPIKMINWFKYGTPLGMTTSLPGLGWIQLGWIGVFLWCGLWGWALGRFYRWFASGPQDAISVSVYLVTFPLLIIGFRDGGLLTMVRQGAFLIAPVVLMIILRRAYNIPTLEEVGLLLARRAKRTVASAGSTVSALPRSVRRRLAQGKPAQ